MHHTRKTHNAHKETQRRLGKLVKNESGGRNKPHYYSIHYFHDGSICYIEPYWDIRGTDLVHLKVHSKNCRCSQSIETLLEVRKRQFYVKRSKSKSKTSYWAFAKKRLHRIWRRKSAEELTYTYKDAKGCSIYNLW